MRTALAALALVLAACSCAGPRSAKQSAHSEEIAALIEAERSFSATAAAEGTRTAFLDYLADDAIIFRPHPVNAVEWYTENTDVSGFLSWTPEYAEISASGDMGYTTGPWEFRSDPGEETADSYGHYVSVWRGRGEGPWRVIADIGIVHEGSVSKIPAVETVVASRPEGPGFGDVDPEEEKEILKETDLSFSEEVERSGLVSAYVAFSTDDIRYYRMGALPLVGTNKVRKALVEADSTVSWTPAGAGVSSAGDLGYTYGTIESELVGPSGASEVSSYLRIWRIEPGRRWSVALDIAIPSGPAQSEAQ